jgi:cytoskeleton protein RodZ
MTAMPSQSSEQDSSQSGFSGSNETWGNAQTASHVASLGNRLQTAREARGLDLAACAHALKLPVNVLRQLERDEYAGIDSKIYLGSYITKYGRHLGLDEASIQTEVARLKQVELPLVATGGISRSRFLLDRYATAATYAVLTAVIVVPMIWLGVRGTLDRDLSHLAPLDAAPVAQQDAPAMPTSPASRQLTATVVPSPLAVAPAPTQEQPLLASMAPFPNLDNGTAVAPAAVDAAPIGSGSHSLSLDLSAASWVEVVDQDGSRLEYGLLPAGSNKTYHSDEPLNVRIGNAVGAQIAIDGAAVALDDFRRANVAHFRVQIEDGKASAASL